MHSPACRSVSIKLTMPAILVILAMFSMPAILALRAELWIAALYLRYLLYLAYLLYFVTLLCAPLAVRTLPAIICLLYSSYSILLCLLFVFCSCSRSSRSSSLPPSKDYG